jgi:hypothetical protein
MRFEKLMQKDWYLPMDFVMHLVTGLHLDLHSRRETERQKVIEKHWRKHSGLLKLTQMLTDLLRQKVRLMSLAIEKQRDSYLLMGFDFLTVIEMHWEIDWQTVTEKQKRKRWGSYLLMPIHLGSEKQKGSLRHSDFGFQKGLLMRLEKSRHWDSDYLTDWLMQMEIVIYSQMRLVIEMLTHSHLVIDSHSEIGKLKGSDLRMGFVRRFETDLRSGFVMLMVTEKHLVIEIYWLMHLGM